MTSLINIAAATILVAATATQVAAATIGFEGATYGVGFTGPVTESGYIYSLASGGLAINLYGNPGQDVEGLEQASGGQLLIAAADGSAFQFGGLDFAVYGLGDIHGITVTGYRHGAFAGDATYSTVSSFIINWMTYGPSTLAGVTLDELVIALPARVSPVFSAGIDNVVLNAVATGGVPEPAAWAMLIAGFAMVGAAQRRRSRALFA